MLVVAVNNSALELVKRKCVMARSIENVQNLLAVHVSTPDEGHHEVEGLPNIATTHVFHETFDLVIRREGGVQHGEIRCELGRMNCHTRGKAR